MAETLGERQAAILRAIVREYVRSGEPVGSKHLVDRTRLVVSSATVRTEMSRLEELGFLTQPHTSAGRIPTDLGYRFVVDELQPRPLREQQQRALQQELAADPEPSSVDELLHRASEVVSRFTHHAAAILARRARPNRIRRVELFGVGAHTAMAVLIAENGRVEQRMIPLGPTVTPADVERLGERLARDLHGTSVENAERTVGQISATAPARDRAMLDGVAAALQSLLDTEQQVVVGGVANLANDAFERGALGRLYEALEQQTAVMQVLAFALEEPVVRIGSEVPAAALRECSVVAAPFGGREAQGSIGVIGPTRMDYERVITAANAVARLLEQTLGTTS